MKRCNVISLVFLFSSFNVFAVATIDDGQLDNQLAILIKKHELKPLSKQELKRLFKAPQRLKHRVLLSLIYSAGLRLGEVCALKISDIDSDRMLIRVVKSKGDRDRYVPLSAVILKGLRRYIQSSKPKIHLFNGRKKSDPLGHGAVQQTFRLAKHFV